MNKIDKLIAELCPDGVEFKDVGKLIEDSIVTTVNPPKKLTKRYYKPIGTFPIVDQGQNFIVGYTDDSKALVANGLYVIFGDHTEAIKYVDFAFAQGADGIKVLTTDVDIINTRFFYYALNNFYEKTGKYTRHFSFLKKTEIPIPPLAIQQEIVKILDAFSALETKLKAELEAELVARKKQYEYYRDELLTFGDEVEWKSLGEVGKLLRGKAITAKETTEGQIPVVANAPQPIYFHGESNRSGETIVIARSGAYAGLVSFWNKPIFLTDAFSVHPDGAVLKAKFVYYLLKQKQETIHSMKKGSGVPHVRVKEFESYPIPIPSLAEQKRIVSILDKFDALVNDLSAGLPAEITARRNQYEYYRNKLLTFKPLEKVHVG